MAATSKDAWSGRSHASTFVHALHLLDLDLLEDWPGVSLETFSAKSTLQHRTRCVEWSLYRLFELFDHRTCSIKLNPFFPPCTPLQSKNLRAALLRQLTGVKTNGSLRPNIIIRKTMLDECKGHKFEELIAAFAVLVLRKVSSPQTNGADLTESKHVVPLILAHRAVLQANLNKRRSVTQNVTASQDANRQELKALNTRKHALEATPVELDPAEIGELERKLFGNWMGDNRWAEDILHGDMGEFHNDNSVAFVQDASGETLSSDLHRNFESAFHKAQARLHNLQAALQVLNQSISPTPVQDKASSSEPPPAFDLTERRHMLRHDVKVTPISEKMAAEHASIFTSLERDLDALNATMAESKEKRQIRSATKQTHLAVPRHVHQTPQMVSQPQNGRGLALSGSAAKPSTSSSSESSNQATHPSDHVTSSSPWLPEINRRPARQPVQGVIQSMESNSDEKLTSAVDVSRTLLQPCNARSANQTLTDHGPSLSHLDPLPPALEPPASAASHENSTLMERTRMSISAISGAASTSNKHKKAKSMANGPVPHRTSSARRSSLQSSYVPDPDVSTLQEELLDGDADYASVFKSRPKLALSPSLSPQKW